MTIVGAIRLAFVGATCASRAGGVVVRRVRLQTDRIAVVGSAFRRTGNSEGSVVRNVSGLAIFLLVACLWSATATAQSVYVAGALGADISLVSGQEYPGIDIPSGGGEALSGAARLGVVLQDRFGIELELSRAGETRSSSNIGGPLPLTFAAPISLGGFESITRLTTISTTASIRQQVADRVALVYLGGVVFHRTDSETEYGFGFIQATGGLGRVTGTFSDAGIASPFGAVLPSTRFESVRYGAGPVVGFEAHIGYGAHFTIIPSIRMHGLPNSWLVRPGVGAGWAF
jgi:hypothetical protein